MEMAKSVAEYFDKNDHWRTELDLLRSICLETEFTETLKWGIPTYTIKGKNVVGIAAFKEYVGLWFFNGNFLSDPQKLLINAQTGKTKGMRQLRFSNVTEINPETIKSYLLEAIENEKAGLRVKIERNKTLIIPEELQSKFDEEPDLKKNFEKFTPYKQKEFADYIAEAKRAETRTNRLLKCIPLIRSGTGLHDKYRS